MTEEFDFDRMEQMGSWLAAAGIDTANWGRGEAKQLADLWAEYVTGETRFEDDPPARLIDVTQVVLRRGGAVLLELAQEFADGRRRVRMRPPSEKMKPGETPRAAAWRCLAEELGLGKDEVALSEAHQVIEEEEDSPSYPGLMTRYRFYVFTATAAALPDADFARDNHAANDPIRRHYWGWRGESTDFTD
jgi:hypothetical protein